MFTAVIRTAKGMCVRPYMILNGRYDLPAVRKILYDTPMKVISRTVTDMISP